MGFLWSLISRRTKLVIEAEKFSLPSETEFFNTIGQNTTFIDDKNGDPKAAVYSHKFADIYFLRREINRAITPAPSKTKILGSGIATLSGVA